ncbi:MAG: hypothetical protein IPK50_07030 [Fibrobacterota bacterium]|nr:hypothetical protein [Fibrobacterota bacterium]QQS06647.1 MAG: hypothetical protein IPK50_07030 [Fibrobacterota bacterium]
MLTQSNPTRADALIRFHRSSFYFALMISLIPRLGFRIGEWFLGNRSVYWLDITALAVFFLILVFVTWRARSVLDYLVAVVTSAIVHTLFFFDMSLLDAGHMERDEMVTRSETWSLFVMQLAMLALVIAALSLPVYLVRRLKA